MRGGLLLLEVVAAAVVIDGVAVEAVVQLVRALGQNVGAVQRARAFVVAGLQGQQGRQAVGRGPGDVDAAGEVIEVAEVLAVLLGEGGVIGVVDPVVAVVPQAGDAHRQGVRGGQGHADFGAGRAIVAIGQRAEAGEVVAGLDGVDLDHARRGVATEQGALRTAQNLDLLHVEQGEALQVDVLQHHVVEHDRDRLRGVEVEVHVAEAANVEARGVTAVRALDLQAGDAAGQLQDVAAARGEGVQGFGVHGRDGEGHFADVLAATLGRDDDLVDGDGLFGGGRGLRHGRGGDEQGETAGGGGEGGEARGHGGRVLVETGRGPRFTATLFPVGRTDVR
ncbi:hypothetical protein D3C72_1034490 [compost metagenome]